MEKYAIYCTEAQTKKALELGAPISYNPFGELSNHSFIEVDNDKEIDYYDIPTAEQMIGWLEEQEELYSIEIEYNSDCKGWSYFLCPSDDDDCIYKSLFSSRKEATIAAVDMALEYLIEVREA